MSPTCSPCSLGSATAPHNRALIEADARALIERFGDQAYSEARERQHVPPVGDDDARRPAHHWECVKEAIRRIEARR